MAQTTSFYDYYTPVNGSLAYDLGTIAPAREWDRERYREPERKVVIPAPPVVKERVATRAKVKTQQSVAPLAIVGFICAAVLLVFTLMAKIQLTVVTDEAVKLETQLAELELAQNRLLIDYESVFNRTEIEEYATTVLGMQRPREEQITYLNTSVPDKAVVLEHDSDTNSFTDRLSDMFGFLGEYFK